MIGIWARPSTQSNRINLSRKLVFFCANIELIASPFDEKMSPQPNETMDHDNASLVMSDGQLESFQTYFSFRMAL